MERRRHGNGFTLIELMIALGLTLIVVGTYLRFFSHTVRYEANNTLKTNVTMKGAHIIDTIEGAIRLIGLGNSSADFKTGSVISAADGAAVSITNGGVLTDAVSFQFVSPWGGPATSVIAASGENIPGCTVTVANSNSLVPLAPDGANNPHLLFITSKGIYDTIVVSPVATPNNLIISSVNPSVSGTCADNFPANATIVTGPNKTYLFTIQNGNLLLQNTTDNRVVFSYPQSEVPYLTMQFLTETKDSAGVVVSRQWVTTLTDCNVPLVSGTPNACSSIKAVRLGIVVTSRDERVDTTSAHLFNYCFFDSYCYSSNPAINKRYAAFSRVIDLRNYGSLKEHLLE